MIEESDKTEGDTASFEYFMTVSTVTVYSPTRDSRNRQEWTFSLNMTRLFTIYLQVRMNKKEEREITMF
jgi:hypothetical protein